MARTGYHVVPPSQLVGSSVQGQVSHTEEDVFWLQMEPDKVAGLLVGDGFQACGGQRVGVGECVVGSWEGDWYRGVVIEEKETEVVVQFVDWGNSAILSRKNVRKSVEKEMAEPVGAVKCRLVGKEKGWEEELQEADYMVKLRCLANYDNMFLMTRDLGRSHTLPMQVNVPGTVGEISRDKKCVWFIPSSLQPALDRLMDQLELVANSLTPLPASQVFLGQLCAARFSQDEAMYRAEAISVKDQVVRVMFIDYGNTEDKSMSELFMSPEELLAIAPYAVKVELGTAVKEDEEEKMLEVGVVIKLVEENGKIVAKVIVDEGLKVCPMPVERMEVKKFPPSEFDENLISKKGKIIEAEMDDGKDDLTPVPVIITLVDDVNTVWVSKSSSLSVLEMMMDQLANMEGGLDPLTEVHEDDIVVARFSEDDGLYRGKVICNNAKGVTVLFMDYGMKEEVSTTKLWRLPAQMAEHEAMAVKVRVEHVEVFEDTLENRETMDRELDKEGIVMRVSMNNEASFWIGGEKIEFMVADNALSPPVMVGGWQVGDEVTFWTEENKRWRKGTISRLEERRATVKEVGDHPAVHCKVDPRHLKPAGMPVEALNQVEVELSETGTGASFKHPKQEAEIKKDQIKEEVTNSDIDSTDKQIKPISVSMSVSVNKTTATPTKSPSKSKLNFVSPISKAAPVNKYIATSIKTKPILVSPVSKSAPVIKSTSTPTKSTSKSKVNPRLLAVFEPTSDITQQMMADWIAGCLHMLHKKELLDNKLEGNIFKVADDKSQSVIKVSKEDTKIVGGIIDVFEEESKAEDDTIQPSPTQLTLEPNSSPSSPTPAQQFLSSVQTVSGSQELQARLDSGSRKDVEDILDMLVTTDIRETNPLSCKLVQSIISKVSPARLDLLVKHISDQFLSLATHSSGHLAVLAVLDVASQDQRDSLISQLEDKELLLRLVMDKAGSAVMLKILPHFHPTALVSLVRNLQGSVVEIGCHPRGSFFLQEFFRDYIGNDMVDLLLEEVMDNLSILAFNDMGNWMVQEVVKLGKQSQVHLRRVACWLEKNLQAVLMNTHGASLARTVVQLLMSQIMGRQVNCWSQILDRLVTKMMTTMVKQDKQDLPLLIVVADHHSGHNVVLELAANKECLVDTKDSLVEMLNEHRSRLKVGTFGCLVVKGMQGWL